MKKIIILLICIFVFLCGCSEEKTQLDEIISKNNYIIVDVRTESEYKQSHIKKSINIPYDKIDKNTNLDKSKTILVYCKSGVRSSKAYNILKNLGYDVVNLGSFDSIDLEKE